MAVSTTDLAEVMRRMELALQQQDTAVINLGQRLDDAMTRTSDALGGSEQKTR